MKTMKNIYYPAWIMIFLTAVPAFCGETIRVGVYNFEPIVFFDQQQRAKGLYIDVLNYIAEKEQWNIEYISGTWTECLEKLENGKIDLLPSVAYSEERAKQFDFTDDFLFLDWGLVYRRKGSRIETIFDLQDKIVSALKGSIYTREFRKLTEQFGINCIIVEKEEYSHVFESVHNKEADLGISGNVHGIRIESRYHIERTQVVFSPVKILFAVKKNRNSGVIRVLNDYISKLKADNDSAYYEFYNKWMGLYQKKNIVPKWIWGVLFTLINMGLIFLLFIILLRRQIRVRTSDLAKVTESLKHSEERFRHAFENANIGVCLVSIEGRFMMVNPQLCKTLGYSRQELENMTVREVTHPDYRNVSPTYTRQAVKGEISYAEYEKQYIHKQRDMVVWGKVSLSLIRDKDGKPLYFIAHVQDITAQKQAEEQVRASLKEKEVLLREIHHRVKNNLTVVQSLIQLQSDQTEDAYALSLFRDLSSRVMAMAMVHEDLYRSENLAKIGFARYLARLVANIRQGFARAGINTKINAPDIFLDVDKAIPCGLIVAELVTNAFKYAFPEISDEKNPEISVELSRNGNMYSLIVSDNGIGIPAEIDWRSTGTLGLELVRAWTTHQLKGTIDADIRHGTTFRITFTDIHQTL